MYRAEFKSNKDSESFNATKVNLIPQIFYGLTSLRVLLLIAVA